MDNDIIETCTKFTSYLNDNNYELIISLLLKEFQGNNLVYINLTKTWYKYEDKDKKWDEYDFKKELLNLSKLYDFFNEIMIEYLDEEEMLSKNNKDRLKRISNNIASYILNGNIKKNLVRQHSCNLFSISENI